MRDLLGTVKRRYGQWPGFFNLSTLIYRQRVSTHAENGRKDAETSNQSMFYELNRSITRRMEQWQLQTTRVEQRRLDMAKRSQRRNEQLFSSTGAQLHYLRKRIKQLTEQEEERQRDMDRKPKTELPLTYRSAARLMEERIARVESALQAEMQAREKRSEREILRRIRDDEYYEKRRRG